ncbi:unnamed protein product [Polarella glacialis]|nr:unnamed protein product [Polarella glacialis]
MVRLRDFVRSGIPEKDRGDRNGARWVVFGYYGVMGPDGEVSQDMWDSLLSMQAPAIPSALPASAGEEEHALQRKPAKLGSPGERRPRSPSADHRLQCEERFGSAKAARRRCARCGWLANRANLLEVLTFMDVDGGLQPWVEENPDPGAPWGLGCTLCHQHKSRTGGGAQKSVYADFTFGVGLPGLLVEALLRHGCNTSRRIFGEGNILGRGHKIALASALEEQQRGGPNADGTPCLDPSESASPQQQQQQQEHQQQEQQQQ